MRPAALLSLLVLLAAPAWAGDGEDIDCSDMTNLPQQEMNYCAAKDYEAADAELNAVWKDAVAAAVQYDKDLKEMGDDGRPGYEDTLRKAQRAWITYRDAWCDYEGFEARGGTLEPLLIAGCLADLTRTRTKDLKDVLEGLGN